MRLAWALVLVAVALGYYLYVAPLPFDAEVGPWEVQPNPERVGVLAPNTLLSKSRSLGQVGFTLRPASSPSHVKVLTTVVRLMTGSRRRDAGAWSRWPTLRRDG